MNVQPQASPQPRGDPPREITDREARSLAIQQFLGWIFFLPLAILIFGTLKFLCRAKIENLPEIRRRFREYVAQGHPIVICGNHLTMIDSTIIIWALASIPYYFFHYRLVSWNIPASEHAKARLSFRIITYLGKCILIDRGGDKNHIDSILAKLRHLLVRGQICTLFPEGTRSRTGKIDREKVTYGIGKILRGVPECRVLCIYLRGRHQKACTDFPARDETFSLTMELLHPRAEGTALRQVKQYADQIMDKLVSMEEQYFARYDSPLDR